MADLERDTAANANAPGYDGSAEVLQQRQAAMHALINGDATATAQAAADTGAGGTLESAGANRGGTLDSTGASMSTETIGHLHQQW